MEKKFIIVDEEEKEIKKTNTPEKIVAIISCIVILGIIIMANNQPTIPYLSSHTPSWYDYTTFTIYGGEHHIEHLPIGTYKLRCLPNTDRIVDATLNIYYDELYNQRPEMSFTVKNDWRCLEYTSPFTGGNYKFEIGADIDGNYNEYCNNIAFEIQIQYKR